MEKQIKLNKRKVSYTLKVNKRAKSLRLAVYCGGDFVVTTPKNVHQNFIDKFIIQKSQWVLDKIDYLSTFSKSVKVKSTRGDYLKYKEVAQKLAEEKVSKFNEIYKFKFNNINIRNQKTRWGSCSKKGNLNFNYKIALLPEILSDYIIVHEICHLGQFNHSQKFWDLVAVAMPDYREIRKSLKGWRLGLN